MTSEKNGLMHPYLYFNSEWVEQFRARLKKDQYIAQEWDRFVGEANQMLEEDLIDESYADGEDSQHGLYGEPSQQIARFGPVLGMVYQVTGENRYAETLRNALLHYGQYEKWYGKGILRNDPPWHSELNTSRFCYGFAVGYDCIYDFLSHDERIQIKDALVQLGVLPTLKDWVLPETRVHTLDSMGHNWWSVMIALAGVGVLSILNEEPEAEGWLESVLRIFPEYFLYKGSVLGNKSPNYDEGGAMYESVNYAHYGLYEYLTLRLAYQEVFGYTDFSDIPMLAKAGEFFLHTTYPSSDIPLTVDFGDGAIHGGAIQSIKLLLANGSRDSRLRWYLQEWKAKMQFDFYDFLYCDRIWDNESVVPAEEKSVIYPEIGWAVMRNGWEKNRTLLAVKSGFTWNHAHADAGSFVLYHNGKPLLIDSGTCSYGRPEYSEYYLQSEAHNVLLFDGAGQPPDDLLRGVKEPGQIYHLVDHGGLRYVYADATGPMSRWFTRNYRHFLWVDDVILVIDDVRAHERGTLQWLLHYEGEAIQELEGRVRVRNEEAEAIVQPLFPEKLIITEKVGLADHNPDVKVTYLSYSTGQSMLEEKFVTAIIPVDPSKSTPEVTPISGNEMIGARIIRDGKRTDVYLNLRADGRIMHQNCIRTLNGWETDAYLLAITMPDDAKSDDVEELERCFIGYGSFLRRNRHPLFSSASRATTCIQFSEKELSVSLQGQPYISAEIRPKVIPQDVAVVGNDAVVTTHNGLITVCQKSNLRARRPG